MEFHVKVIDLPVLLPENNSCDLCIERLREKLSMLRGIIDLAIQKNGHEIEIKYDPNFISLEKIEEKVKEIGIHLDKQYKHESVMLEGLDCPDCASKLEKSISHLKGVAWVSVSYTSGKMWFEYEPETITLSDISVHVQNIGYSIKDIGEEVGEERSVFQISGMDSIDCASKLERRISKGTGGKAAMV